MNNPNNYQNKKLWKLKLPLKIKVFLEFMSGAILTKDNLAKRCWKGYLTCNFCKCNESIQHLFLTAI
jgi:hypothetical protein